MDRAGGQPSRRSSSEGSRPHAMVDATPIDPNQIYADLTINRAELVMLLRRSIACGVMNCRPIRSKERCDMSTNFRLSKEVTAGDLFGGRLENHGIREHQVSDADELRRCLTDGDNNFLWIWISDNGLVGSLTRYAPNGNPGKILHAIAEEFDTDIFGEHEPQYWSFATVEEWDAAWEAMPDRIRDEFYANVCAYVRGEANDIQLGTADEIRAKVAKTLVDKDATLLAPESKDKLLDEVDAIYQSKIREELDLTF
jgi:hypothetical protein